MEIHFSDFETQDLHNSLSFFGFELIFEENLGPGVYVDPPLAYLEYHIVGALPMGSPSGINVFHLTRIMDGDEFYSQGSSMQFEIVDGAELCDGLQFSEMVGRFELNAVEFETGQYHCPLFTLNSDGTGNIKNANNSGGTNPHTGMDVDVDFGEEYDVNLQFDAENYSIAPPVAGDMNFDCSVDLLDVEPFVEALTNPRYDLSADMNRDGSDNILDVILFVLAIIG